MLLEADPEMVVLVKQALKSHAKIANELKTTTREDLKVHKAKVKKELICKYEESEKLCGEVQELNRKIKKYKGMSEKESDKSIQQYLHMIIDRLAKIIEKKKSIQKTSKGVLKLLRKEKDDLKSKLKEIMSAGVVDVKNSSEE